MRENLNMPRKNESDHCLRVTKAQGNKNMYGGGCEKIYSLNDLNTPNMETRNRICDVICACPAAREITKRFPDSVADLPCMSLLDLIDFQLGISSEI